MSFLLRVPLISLRAFGVAFERRNFKERQREIHAALEGSQICCCTRLTQLQRAAVGLVFALSLLSVSCSSRQVDDQSARPIRWIATTSVRDTGLLEALAEDLEHRTHFQIEVVAVGTGQALQLGRSGDADLLLTHAPNLEAEFLAEGLAVREVFLMSNDFVIVGPTDDPAMVQQATDVLDAFQRIAQSKSPWVSRADRSGTAEREEELWRAAEIASTELNRIETGLGQAASLQVASERNAYTLTDRATWIVHRESLNLALRFENDERLSNRYRLIEVIPTLRPAGNDPNVARLFDELVNRSTQEFIRNFGVQAYGRSLFKPAADEH